MKVSLGTIKQFTDVDLTVDELVAKINQQLGGVEEVIDLSDKYKDTVIVRVVECEKHPNADKLSVCLIDIGDHPLKSKIQNPKSSELIQVVCGAPNVHADMWAIWLPPGATVPASYDDEKPFVLDVRDIRGVRSHGMLAAANELAIGSDHTGIIELTDNDLHPKSTIQNLKSGQNFAEVFGLNDTIIDIENKMFTHRPDLFGQLGVAREIAGIQGKQFTSPDWYRESTNDKRQTTNGKELELIVQNDAPDVVPRFMAVVIRDVTVRPSPFWLRCELVRLGSKPINNIVDVTNYVMLLTAQPTHAYDYDKLRASTGRREEKTLGTRFAQEGETITLLNGKTYELDESDIVIVDGEGPVGLGGIMGGGNSEVSDTTKNVVLECANFDMYAIRKSSMRHGLFTDAVTRFNKGQSPLQNAVVMDLLMELVTDVASGIQASDVIDNKNFEDIHDKVLGKQWMPQVISPEFINKRLGLQLSGESIEKILENVQFDIHEVDQPNLCIQPPFWRTDIEQPEDIVEEVGRLNGFDKLPRELPTRGIQPAPKNLTIETKRRVRDVLSRAGANEVLTYSFVHENVMTRAGQDSSHAYQLSNALSPDLQYYRTALVPSLLDNVHMNIKAGHDKFALFEIGKVHYKGEMDNAESNVPNEDSHIGFVIAYGDKQRPDGAPYFHAKFYADLIVETDMQLLQLSRFDLATDEWGAQLTAPYEPSRSAVLVRDGQIWGVVGEFTTAVKKAFKLPNYTAGFELHLDIIKSHNADYKPLSRFPHVSQDITLKVKDDVTYESLSACLYDALQTQTNSDMTVTMQPVSLYKPADDNSHKTMTWRIDVAHNERTLTDDDVSSMLRIAADAATTTFAAELV
ncbi:MAG: phenylalanine--tRNA ligase subunit beta [Candidatus Saccharimonadales bacterium]